MARVWMLRKEVQEILNGGGGVISSEQGATVNYQCKVTAKDGLNCRPEPSQNPVLTTYPYGTTLVISKEKNGWGFTGLGWVSLKYVEKIATTESTKEDDDMDVNRFTELWKEMRSAWQDNDAGDWSAKAREWATSNGLIAGNGTTINGEPNCMWADMLTREQFVAVLYRFAQLMGKA